MKNNPLVSIIIPVYNTEEYLEECLDSLRNQTLKDIEIICIDDASNDNSSEILNYYVNMDDRIKLLKNKFNQGCLSRAIKSHNSNLFTLLYRKRDIFNRSDR